MHLLAVLQILVLIALANGAPVIAKTILRERWAYPLDAGLRLPDGAPLLGASKTIRGILLSVLVTSAGAPLVGLHPRIGFLVGITAMAGDLMSSFLKRRLGLAASSRAVGIDQVPESLLPFLACRETLALTVLDIGIGVAIFFIAEVLMSRVLYRLKVRDQPY